jgi:hypothetical protein
VEKGIEKNTSSKKKTRMIKNHLCRKRERVRRIRGFLEVDAGENRHKWKL